MFMRGVSFGKLTGTVCDTVAQNKTKMIDSLAESIIVFMRGSGGASKNNLRPINSRRRQYDLWVGVYIRGRNRPVTHGKLLSLKLVKSDSTRRARTHDGICASSRTASQRWRTSFARVGRTVRPAGVPGLVGRMDSKSKRITRCGGFAEGFVVRRGGQQSSLDHQPEHQALNGYQRAGSIGSTHRTVECGGSLARHTARV